MKVGALIVGILGGLVALCYGFIGFGLSSMGDDGGGRQLSVAVPIAALVGAGIVVSKPLVGAGLMGAAAYSCSSWVSTYSV